MSAAVPIPIKSTTSTGAAAGAGTTANGSALPSALTTATHNSDDSPIHKVDAEAGDHESSHYATKTGAAAAAAVASKPMNIPTNSASQNRAIPDFSAVPTDSKKIGLPMSPLAGSSSPLYRRRRSNADQAAMSPRTGSGFGFGMSNSPRHSASAGLGGIGSLGKSSGSLLLAAAAASAAGNGATPPPSTNGASVLVSPRHGATQVSTGFAPAPKSDSPTAAATTTTNGSAAAAAAAAGASDGTVVVPAVPKLVLKAAAPKPTSVLASPGLAAALHSVANGTHKSAATDSGAAAVADGASPRVPVTPSPSPLTQPHVALTGSTH